MAAKKFPAELDRLKLIRKAHDDLDRGTDSLFGFGNRMTPNREAIGRAEASEKAAHEALSKMAG